LYSNLAPSFGGKKSIKLITAIVSQDPLTSKWGNLADKIKLAIKMLRISLPIIEFALP
jgi:hypothetical protein